MKRHKVTAGQAGARLDAIVKDWLNITRSQAARAIRSGEILLNELRVKPGEVVGAGDQISYNEIIQARPSLDIPIVFEDPDIMVLDKPAGLVVHPTGAAQTDATLVDFVRRHTIDPDASRPGIVHRLDRDTSGLIIVAKNLEAKNYMQRLFADRKVTKEYIALVSGRIPKDRAEIDLPIGAGAGVKRLIDPTGRAARTVYEVIKRYPDATLLNAWPKSGRTHQLRVHFAAIGHPIVGDALYGHSEPDLHRQFLHAHKLAFTSPSGKFVEVTSPLPKSLKSYLSTLV